VTEQYTPVVFETASQIDDEGLVLYSPDSLPREALIQEILRLRWKLREDHVSPSVCWAAALSAAISLAGPIAAAVIFCASFLGFLFFIVRGSAER
jgi:hypothetical protein